MTAVALVSLVAVFGAFVITLAVVGWVVDGDEE